MTPRFDVVTLGETMLRLTPPGLRRIEQTQTFDLEIGGSESNTSVGLARMGLKVAWLSRLTDNPMGGGYQRWIGGQYQVLEASAMFVPKAGLNKTLKGRQISYTANWVRSTPWLPWMAMAGREGGIIMTTQGRSYESFAALPQPLRGLIETRWPLMKRAPEFDDKRPFITSWKSMKQALDARADAREVKPSAP